MDELMKVSNVMDALKRMLEEAEAEASKASNLGYFIAKNTNERIRHIKNELGRYALMPPHAKVWVTLYE